MLQEQQVPLAGRLPAIQLRRRQQQQVLGLVQSFLAAAMEQQQTHQQAAAVSQRRGQLQQQPWQQPRRGPLVVWGAATTKSRSPKRGALLARTCRCVDCSPQLHGLQLCSQLHWLQLAADGTQVVLCFHPHCKHATA